MSGQWSQPGLQVRLPLSCLCEHTMRRAVSLGSRGKRGARAAVFGPWVTAPTDCVLGSALPSGTRSGCRGVEMAAICSRDVPVLPRFRIWLILRSFSLLFPLPEIFNGISQRDLSRGCTMRACVFRRTCGRGWCFDLCTSKYRSRCTCRHAPMEGGGPRGQARDAIVTGSSRAGCLCR